MENCRAVINADLFKQYGKEMRIISGVYLVIAIYRIL